MGGFATMRGAEIIEVHFKLAETPKDNPDAPHSLTYAQLLEYVDLIQCQAASAASPMTSRARPWLAIRERWIQGLGRARENPLAVPAGD